MLQLKQWITTVVLAGLIAAIGTIVFVSIDTGNTATTTTVDTPQTEGDVVQPPIIITPDTAAQSPLTPSEQSTAIPTQIFNPTSTSPPTISYTVKSGDTLSAIADAHGVSVNEIVQHSNLANPDRLDVGQVLIIPVR